MARSGRSERSHAYFGPDDPMMINAQQTACRSGKSEMTAIDAESWARLRLVQGESSAEKWELVSSSGHTTLTVGSGADCTWVVREEGVRPLHFSLHWDGSTLRVADVYSAGDVRVDGSLLTSQWRPLVGRVRIDFGHAALVVETSSSVGRSSEHPLDLGEPRAKSSSPPRKGVETLIGVAPLNKVGTPVPSPPLQGYVPGRTLNEAPASSPPSGPASEAARSARAAASMKATLVGGIAVGETHTLPPGTLPPSIQVVDTTGSSSSAPPASGGPKPNATLMGFSVSDALRGAVGTQPSVQVGGGALYEPDQRTVQSYPPKPSSSAPPAGAGAYGGGGRRMTQQGHVVPPSSGRSDPPAPRSAPPPAGRIGSAWQEGASEVGYGTEPATGALPGVDEAPPPDARGGGGGKQRDFAERLSDIPTQMRDPTTFSSRRPTRGVPWRYVGVLLLTAVAYFAWLYLLDHL